VRIRRLKSRLCGTAWKKGSAAQFFSLHIDSRRGGKWDEVKKLRSVFG
jgi:hypothetical protein